METILIKVEEPTGDCQKCFYYSSDNDGGNERCCRPENEYDRCVEKGKYYIFIEQPKTNI